MEISDSFRVNRSLDETWKVLLDPYADAVGNATIKYHSN